MREQRWESQHPISFDQITTLRARLKDKGLKVRGMFEETACYIEELSVDHIHEIDRLDPWTIEEMTLLQINERWEGDFFLLAGTHHDLYRKFPDMEGYLSICHPWHIPDALEVQHHETEALFWVGFRETHGFVRVRVVPAKIITPGETDTNRLSWISERVRMFSSAIELLDLPLFVEWHQDKLSIVTEGMDAAVSVSWPDAFGPCQFEYVVSDRYSLLVPGARLVAKTGKHPAIIKTFLSGFTQEALQAFHQLQPGAKMIYRGYIHACLNNFPEVIEAMKKNKGRALMTLCEFQTEQFLPDALKASAVMGLIGDTSGFKLEIRLNRSPLPPDAIAEWLLELTGLPVSYAPLTLV